ncbi:unnamed protein product [Clavelina lepadiformis]|uniref:RNA methyltransferase n=1 Tax=Clavelina lepadiformis TaxID=159417 RepID=A0ABP0EZ63_CLALP
MMTSSPTCTDFTKGLESFAQDSFDGKSAALNAEVEKKIDRQKNMQSNTSIQDIDPNVIKPRKFLRKRRHSTAEEGSLSHLQIPNKGSGQTAVKHRRTNPGHHKKGYVGDIILPTKFLLGGNISDPLNLNSMLDENINRALNAVTPSSSPLPPRSSKINIVIPSDMTDPLGLNIANDEDEKSTGSLSGSGSILHIDVEAPDAKANHKKKKRRRKSQHEKNATLNQEMDISLSTEICNLNKVAQTKENNCHISLKESRSKKAKLGVLDIDVTLRDECMVKAHPLLSIAVPKVSTTSIDPIVSPVIPQDVKKSSLFSPKTKKRKSSSVNASKQLFHLKHIDSKEGLLMKEKSTDLQTPATDCEKSAGSFSEKNDKLGTPTFKLSNARFQYGNYCQYYGYRNPQKFKDIRMESFHKEWFKEKDVLDVGCNVGHLTLLIARDFSPRKIVGVDIDEGLIKAARNNVRHYATAGVRPPVSNATKYPDSMPLMYGPIVGPPIETGKDDLPRFPNNIIFLTGNYVPVKDEVLQYQEPEYDVIMCMSVTKWLHMNWGDDGLKKTFQRFFKQLRPGGKLILEPQEWKSYGKKKKLTERIYKNYYSIKLKPSMFPTYLVKDVGFEKVEYIQLPSKNNDKGFQRAIQLYHKPE